MWSKLFTIITLLFILSSCTDKLIVRKNKINEDYAYLVDSIQNNFTNYSTYSIKYSGKFKSNNSNLKFKGLLRIIKEKRIWISISSMGIEVARLLFTPDTVKVINRKDKTYFEGNYNYFNKKFNIKIEYNLLENILTNRFFIKNNHQSTSYAKTKEGLIKIDLNESNQKQQTYFLNPDVNKLTKVIFKDFNAKSVLKIVFSNFLNEQHHMLPENIHVIVEKEKHQFSTLLNYKKITIDNNIKTPFRIPGKYQQIWP